MRLSDWINGLFSKKLTLLEQRQKEFNDCKKQADDLHKLTGRRYHVVPKGRDGFIVVDNQFIKAYNKVVKSKGKMITITDLLRMSLYSTSVQGLTRN